MQMFSIRLSSGDIVHFGVKGQKWGVRNGPPYPLLDSSDAPKNTKKLDGYKGHCYFISEKEMDGKELKPRIPSNYLTKHGYEDSETSRICFTDDVGKCLTALSQNVKGKTFNVYEPDDIKKYSVYKPNTKAVPDSDITGELWITEPVKLKNIGRITVTGDDGKPGKRYKYGSKYAELYGWDYEWKR